MTAKKKDDTEPKLIPSSKNVDENSTDEPHQIHVDENSTTD